MWKNGDCFLITRGLKAQACSEPGAYSFWEISEVQIPGISSCSDNMLTDFPGSGSAPEVTSENIYVQKISIYPHHGEGGDLKNQNF